MAADRISVMIVDDQAMVRYGFALIVEAEEDMTVVAQVGDGEEAIAQAPQARPDVVLMDIRMPRLDGIAATERLLALPGLEETKVIVLTTFDDTEYVLGALRAGAAGFLLKDVDPQGLVDAIRRVHQGDGLLDPAVTRTVIESYVVAATSTNQPPATGALADAGARGGADHPDSARFGVGQYPVRPRLGHAGLARARQMLSTREMETWELVAAGKSNREIGEELGITEATVKAHITSLLAKLGVPGRVQAVILAYDVGLVAPAD